jgi:hypothetical protein
MADGDCRGAFLVHGDIHGDVGARPSIPVVFVLAEIFCVTLVLRQNDRARPALHLDGHRRGHHQEDRPGAGEG